MVTATFRFYEELNDFLARGRRRRDFTVPCARAATTKHMIEALGVPHTEVELILLNGVSVGFSTLLREGDRVAVYPKFEAFDITPLLCVRDQPLRDTRFVADTHLGSLAHLLRMMGFDTLHDNGFADDEIERIAAAQGRIVLTRDRDLLKRRSITHGCYVHALRAPQQLREIFERLDLARSARPFKLCPGCNAPLHAVPKSQVAHRLPARVCDLYDRFSTCEVCGRVFWEGEHWQRVRALVEISDFSAPPTAPEVPAGRAPQTAPESPAGR